MVMNKKGFSCKFQTFQYHKSMNNSAEAKIT